MAGLIELLRLAQEELEKSKFVEAEKTLTKAVKISSTAEDRHEVIRLLLKLCSQYLKVGENNKPKILFEMLDSMELSERTTVMERLARLHRELEDLQGAEKIYTEIFELRVKQLGPEHPDAVGALNTAALLRQMQGRSAEDLYKKAIEYANRGPAKLAEETKKSKEKNRDDEKASGAGTADKTSSAEINKEAAANAGKSPEPESGKETAKELSHEEKVREIRRKASKLKTTTLHLLDEVLKFQEKPESAAGDSAETEAASLPTLDEIAEFIAPPLTLQGKLKELIASWEPFCNQLSRQLVKLLQQNTNQAYRNTLLELSSLLSDPSGIKQVNLESPFLACSRRPECNYLDWKIVKELAPVYAAYDGTAKTYPFEIGMLYAALRRAFALGPLHVDTLQNLYRIAHIYSQEIFGCYDLNFSASAFRICGLAFTDHPEIDDLMRVRCRTQLANVLMEMGDFASAKIELKEAVKLSESCVKVSRPELLAILKILAECTHQIGDYETSAGVYERIRHFQEAVSRDAELFETFLHLIDNYKQAGEEEQVQKYMQRLQWELDWFKDSGAMRETIALKAEELEQHELAEIMLHEIIMTQETAGTAIAGRAINHLVRIYEKTGRKDMATKLLDSTKV